eukprot:TRINITY_DN5650_c0_g2_i1.p1 TRINITY_DN5650_c0_g2~~TRINITY_DN5650_c0_g2_i1.p1  ORF type:complete len:187 (-),score=49.69 TRINITY_DN5650_c0_g2_i1:60-620(-)
MDKTIDQIVKASSLPLSIIIVGIGDEDFSSMEHLDARKQPLYSKTLQKEMERDIVRFVKFSKYNQNMEQLACKTLKEVPDQLTSYMSSKGRRPTDKCEARVRESFFERQRNEFSGKLTSKGFTDQQVSKILSKNLPDSSIELYYPEVLKTWASETSRKTYESTPKNAYPGLDTNDIKLMKAYFKVK